MVAVTDTNPGATPAPAPADEPVSAAPRNIGVVPTASLLTGTLPFTSKQLRGLIQPLLPLVNTLDETLPPEVVAGAKLMPRAKALAQIRCPFLAIFGELDPLLPAHESALICGQALRKADNADATLVLFPQGNHRIMLADCSEFVPGYLDLLADRAAHRVPEVQAGSETLRSVGSAGP